MNTHFQFTAGLMFAQEGSKPFLLSVLNDICSVAPDFLPSRYGQAEPLKHEFVIGNLSDIIKSDDKHLLWKTELGLFGEWTTGIHLPRKRHNSISFYGEVESINVKPLLALFEILSYKHGIHYGWIHALSDAEFTEYKSDSYEAIRPFNSCPSTHDLQRWLPNLAWGNIFGKPYIELLNRQKLLNCPAFSIKEWFRDTIYIQLTENINSIPQEFMHFDTLRRRAIAELGAEFFFSPGAMPGSKTVPTFF